MYVFSSDNDFFFLSFLFFLFLRLSRFPDCIFLFFLFFSLLCLPALLTVFLSPPFLIFLPYFPPHIHLAPEPEEIYHYPLSSPFAFNPIRTCNFISHFSHKYVSFLKKSIYIYIFDKRNILYSAASNSNSSLEQNYNLDEIYISDVTVDVTKWKI